MIHASTRATQPRRHLSHPTFAATRLYEHHAAGRKHVECYYTECLAPIPWQSKLTACINQTHVRRGEKADTCRIDPVGTHTRTFKQDPVGAQLKTSLSCQSWYAWRDDRAACALLRTINTVQEAPRHHAVSPASGPMYPSARRDARRRVHETHLCLPSMWVRRLYSQQHQRPPVGSGM